MRQHLRNLLWRYGSSDVLPIYHEQGVFNFYLKGSFHYDENGTGSVQPVVTSAVERAAGSINQRPEKSP